MTAQPWEDSIRIAITGAGNVGAAPATTASGTGHDVAAPASTAESTGVAAQKSGARATSSNTEAAQGTDLVVPTTPHTTAEQVTTQITDSTDSAGDTTNPLNASCTEDLRELLPHGHLVKASTTVFSSPLRRPSQDGAAIDASIAGDDASAKAQVGKFTASLGSSPLDSDAPRTARTPEKTALPNTANNRPRQSTWKPMGPTPGAENPGPGAHPSRNPTTVAQEGTAPTPGALVAPDLGQESVCPMKS